jgi:hypothetical protein
MGGNIRPAEKTSDLFGNGTRDLPVCSMVPQPPILLHDPLVTELEF